MKLNVGAGGRRLPGYVGVDVVQRKGVDVLAPANKLPFDDASVDELLAVHLVEHIDPWELDDTLAEWHRVMKPGGSLVLELPDLLKCCRNILKGTTDGGKHPDQLGLWGLFGDERLRDPHMMHRWSYHFGSLAPRVKKAGFVDCVEKQTAFHPVGIGRRDFRLEARKPGECVK